MQNSINFEVATLIKEFDLKPHPEGGFFKEVYRSQDIVNPISDRYEKETRCAGTSIYYLLAEKGFSAWHCLKSDEIWYYHLGTSLILYTITKDGSLNQQILGHPLQDKKAKPQITIPEGIWFAAELINKESYILLGCTVFPGFEMKDFKLANRAVLVHKYPQYTEIIERLGSV